jgi:hypothetical protein
MKRFLMLVAVAAVAGAMYVAAAPGGQQAQAPTARQFTALKKKVARLSKTLKTLKKSESALKTDEGKVKTLAGAEAVLLNACVAVAVPIDQFGDGTNQTQGYRYAPTGAASDPATTDMLTTALDASASTDTNAVWFVGGDSTCGTALTGGTSGASLGRAAAAAGFSLRHASLAHAFAAHRP